MADKLEVIITATDRASGPIGGVRGALSGLASVAGGIIGAQVLTNVANGIVSTGQAALEAVSFHERLGASLESLVAREIRSADATLSMSDALEQAGPRAEDLLGWVQELAINSPFDSEGVALAMRTALAYGFTTEQAQTLTEQMIDFVAATGGTSAQMDQVARALGQIQAKGKLAGGEILQLVNAGVPVNSILQEMGYTLDDVSEGAVSAEEFIAAFSKTMEEDFGGAAERQSETWTGLINTFGDLKTMGLRSLFEGLFTAIQPLVQQFATWLQGPGLVLLQEWGTRIGEWTATTIPNLVEGIEDLAAKFSEVGSAIQSGDLQGVIAALFGPEVAERVSGITSTISDLVATIQEMATAFQEGGLAEALEVAFGGEIAEKVTGFVTTLTDFRDRVLEIVGAFQEGGLQGALDSIFGEDIGGRIGEVVAQFAGFGEQIRTALSGVVTSATPLANQIGQLFTSIGSFVQSALPIIGTVAAAIAGLFMGLVGAVSSAIGPFLQMLSGIVQGVVQMATGIITQWTGLFNIIVGLVTGNSELIRQGWETIKTGAQQAFEGAKQIIVSIVTGLVSTVLGLVDGFIGGVVNFFASLVGESSNTWEQVKQAILQKARDIKAQVESWARSIPQIIRGLAGSLREAGIAAFQGLLGGIQSKIAEVRAWIDENIGGLAEKVRSILGIRSPSKVFEEIGARMIEGLLEGLDSLINDYKEIIQGFWNITDQEWAKVGERVIAEIENIDRIFGEFARGKIMDAKREVGLFIKALGGIPNRIQVTINVTLTGSGLAFLAAMSGLGGGGGGRSGGGTGVPGGGGAFGIASLMQIRRNYERVGEEIGNGLVQGLRLRYGPFRQLLGEYIAAGEALGSIAQGFGDFLTKTTIDPLRKLVEEEMARAVELEELVDDPAALAEAKKIIEDIADEKARIADLEELTLSIQQKQDMLGFLRQQFELVKLIRDNKLDPKEILGDFRFGTDADPVDFLTALGRAMDVLIAKSSSELDQFEQPMYSIMSATGSAQASIEELANTVASTTPIFEDWGYALIEDVFQAIDDKIDEIGDGFNALFGVANPLMGLANSVIGRIQKEQLKPLEKSLDFNKDLLSGLIADFQALNPDWDWTQFNLENLVQVRKLIIWARKQGWVQGVEELEKIAAQIRVVNDLKDDYNELEEKTLAIQKAQEDLNFLRQQFELLQMIRDYGLDPGAILGGLQLGLDADLDQLLQAMTLAMQALVEKTQEELGIHSPSRIFYRFGQQIMQGLADGISAGARGVERVMGRVLPTDPRFALGIGAAVPVSQYNLTINTNAPHEPIIRDFESMRTWSRG